MKASTAPSAPQRYQINYPALGPTFQQREGEVKTGVKSTISDSVNESISKFNKIHDARTSKNSDMKMKPFKNILKTKTASPVSLLTIGLNMQEKPYQEKPYQEQDQESIRGC